MKKVWARKQTGFTIVELLIVIVVIAILAAITIVGYNGITNNAKRASVDADIASATKKLEAEKVLKGSYPPSLASIGVVASSGNSFDYTYAPDDNSYCIAAKNGAIRRYASSDNPNSLEGGCGSESLIGRWALNGDARDSTENGHHGVMTGVSLAVSQNGATNSAYSFSAQPSNINFGSKAEFNQRNLTFSIWANTTSPASSQILMGREHIYKFRIQSNGVGYLIGNNGSWLVNKVCIATFSPNTWYHFSWSVSADTQQSKMYVNGAKICDTQESFVLTAFPTRDLMIGAHNLSNTENFIGRLDDARFYNRVLSDAEVMSIYTGGAE